MSDDTATPPALRTPDAPRRMLVTARAVYAGDPPRPEATAMVVQDGRVAWVGSAEEVPRPVPRHRLDLGDATVVPGLIDSHQHLLDAGFVAGWIDCRTARTPEEAVMRLRRGAPAAPEGAWIVGWGYDAGNAEGGRRATRSMLDTVSTDRPVLLIESSFHQGAAGSAALAAVGFGRDTPRWWGGELERDRRGEPTGMLWERAFGVVAWKARLAEVEALGPRQVDTARQGCRTLLAQGITHAGEALVAPGEVELFRGAGLPVGFTLMPSGGHGPFATPWDALDGPRTGEGDPGLGIGHLKLFADGGERCALAIPLARALRQVAGILGDAVLRRDPTGLRVLTSARASLRAGRLVSGTLHYPPGSMADVMASALKRGFRVAVHALGNLGVEATLDAYEEARRRTGIDVAGCRIEHAMLAERRSFDRAAALGLILSMQPGHAVHYARTLRVAHADRAFDPVPMRIAVDAGCRVAISSDGPTAPGTALENMRAAVDRAVADGTTIRPDLAIGRTEALRAATVGGAEACGVDGTKGSLAPGKQADFAVLSGDPFDPATTVLQTWIAGERRHPDA